MAGEDDVGGGVEVVRDAEGAGEVVGRAHRQDAEGEPAGLDPGRRHPQAAVAAADDGAVRRRRARAAGSASTSSGAAIGCSSSATPPAAQPVEHRRRCASPPRRAPGLTSSTARRGGGAVGHVQSEVRSIARPRGGARRPRCKARRRRGRRRAALRPCCCSSRIWAISRRISLRRLRLIRSPSSPSSSSRTMVLIRPRSDCLVEDRRVGRAAGRPRPSARPPADAHVRGQHQHGVAAGRAGQPRLGLGRHQRPDRGQHLGDRLGLARPVRSRRPSVALPARADPVDRARCRSRPAVRSAPGGS